MARGFELLSKLSDGAAEEVFLAAASDTQERVVLEVVRSELSVDRALLDEFIGVTKSRKSLSHASLLRRVAGGYMPDGRLFVQSEPVEDTLRAWLNQKGPLSAGELIQVGIEICRALHYLHLKGTVHGNLSPKSVLVRTGPTGVSAKLFDSHPSLFRLSRPIALPKGVVLVPPEYLCPERAGGQRGSVRSDIYALGVLFYEALTGEPPFRSADPSLTRRMHLTERPPSLPPHCSALGPVIFRCLAKDPNMRFGSAADVEKALFELKESSQAKSTSPVAPSARPVVEGEVVGSYRLERLLGEGAMGQVFLASHIRLGRKVALKMLRPALAQDLTEVQRFFHEARIVNQISHPHIVQIHDFVDEHTDDGRHRVFCVMELLDGSTLRERMEKAPLSLQEILRIAAQVADAVEAAHRVGVLHRDLKPDNLFLTRRDNQLQTKILDFGIAKLQDQLEASGDWSVDVDVEDVGMTAAGAVVGTPAYMSPEQASAGSVDARSDIYALGGVLFRALAGKLPFSASNMDELMEQLLHKPAPRLPELSVSAEPIPKELSDLVDQCLQKRPEDRPASMAELAKSLASIQRAVEQSKKATRTAVKTASVSRRPDKRWAIAGGVLALLPLSWVAFRLVGATSGDSSLSSAVQVESTRPRSEPLSTAESKADGPLLLVEPAAAVRRSNSYLGPILVSIRSDPAGAKVERMDTGEVLGRTPYSAHFPRGTDPIPLRVSLPERRPSHLTVDAQQDFTATVRLPRE